MGLFDSLRKIAQGKPVFEDGAGSEAGTTSYHNAQGGKIYPELIVERSECDFDGPNMKVYAVIKNVSAFPLTLDRLRFLGSDKQSPSDLKIGEAMQYLIYDGPRPKQGGNSNFEITFRNEARDYFSALYYAEFRQENDGTYSVKQFHRQREIKDI